ncbi:hypothetical protein [Streptomyces sp. RFCAC02]|uniref:hypothetical protein n=1 Tax=Streptomyces sp. RFCAC02 TaxID=2499143 RepID=UPI001021F34B|nr:hypothetical protein [Streptomyces sp. RFCAC02]
MITAHALPTKESLAEPTAATRHLCVGVYVDERFRDLVIDEVCTAPYRRVAPSYGFDIVPVMRHAWRAAALSTILRSTLVGSVVVPALVGALPCAVLVGCGLALLWLLRVTRVLREADRERQPRRTSKRREWELAIIDSDFLGLLFPDGRARKPPVFRRIRVVALSVAATGSAVAVSDPGQALAALAITMGMAFMCLGVGATRQLMLNRIHRARDLRPARLSGRQRAADLQQHHTCAVYRRPRHSEDDDDEEDLTFFTLFGDTSPFIGAGELVYQWNPPMSIQLLRPSDDDGAQLHDLEHREPPFQTHELVDHLREAVRLLDTDSQEVRLPTQVRDRVYVAETDVAADPSLLARPLDDAELRAVINTPGARRHHFLEVTTPMAGSEYVATVLLRVNVQGRTLSISMAACVLAHTPRSFQQTEEFGQHGAMAVVWSAFRELRGLPREIQRSWRVVRHLGALGKAAVLPRDLTSEPRRNVLIGSRVSIRETSSQAWSKVQLEKSEILGQMKTIELRLLRAASDFLSTKEVDISEFTHRAMKIINSGIFNFGDNNSFNNNAVGDTAHVGVAGNQPVGSGTPSAGGKQ